MSNRTHKVMARREWAEKWAFDASEGDTAQIRMTVAAKRLQAEHARAVRVVKRHLKMVMLDRHVFTAPTRKYLIAMLREVLADLQKGRA